MCGVIYIIHRKQGRSVGEGGGVEGGEGGGGGGGVGIKINLR